MYLIKDLKGKYLCIFVWYFMPKIIFFIESLKILTTNIYKYFLLSFPFLSSSLISNALFTFTFITLIYYIKKIFTIGGNQQILIVLLFTIFCKILIYYLIVVICNCSNVMLTFCMLLIFV